MGQNVIDLGYDVDKLSAEQKIVVEYLSKTLALAEQLDGRKIAPDISGQKGLTDAFNKQSKVVDELQLNIKEYNNILAQTATAQAKQNALSSEAAEKLAAEKEALRQRNAEVKNAALLNQAAEGSINQMKAALAQLTAQYDKLSAAERNSAEGKELQVKIRTQVEDLKKVEAETGRFQRNVGNYASGWASFNNIIRETPNFAISATTGIQSLSNNIPMFADEISKARKEGKSFGTILGELGKNLMSFGGIATLFTIALTALPKILSAMSTESSKTAKAIGTLSEVQKEAAKSTINEKVELEALLVVAKDDTKTRSERSAAVKKINDIMPDYLGKITLEGINTAETAEIINGYISMLGRKALAQAYITKIQELYVKQIEIESSKIEDNIEWYSLLWQTIKNGSTPSAAAIELTNKGIKSREENIKSVSNEIEVLKKKFNEDLKSGKAILDLDKKLTESKEKKDKTDEINRKAAYETNKMILEAQRDQFKSIADDEQNSMAVRIVSLQQFNKKVFDLIILKRDFELSESKITEVEKNKIYTESNILTIKAETDFLKILRDMKAAHLKEVEKKQKEADQIAKNNREEAIKKADSKVSAEELRNQTRLNKDLNNLAQRYLDGEIKSYEEYELEKERITQQSLIRTNISVIAALKEKSKLFKSGTKEYEEIQEKISALDKKSTESFINENKKKKEKFKQDFEEIAKIASKATALIGEAMSTQFTEQKNQVQEVENKQQESYESEVDRIKNSTLSEEEKANKLKILESQRQADKQKNAREQKRIDIEKAKLDRDIAILNIIINTATAVVKAMPNIPLAIATGVLGAAELAIAASAPLPKYADGTDYHPGGFAMVGEGSKPELVTTPGGNSFIADKAMILDLPAGTTVEPFSSDDINQVMYQAMLKKQSRIFGMAEEQERNRFGNGELVAKIDQMNRNVVKAIKDQKQSSTVVNNNINLGWANYIQKEIYN
jgi:hypothetical protein